MLYTGPVYVGTMQMAPNKSKYGQVQKIYRLKVCALYTWDGASWNLVSNANIATEFNNLKTFLGVDASNKIQYGGQACYNCNTNAGFNDKKSQTNESRSQ